MTGLVNRIRLEAEGHSKEEVENALTQGMQFIAQSWGGTWYEDEERRYEIQTTRDGFWGFIWIKRLELR